MTSDIDLTPTDPTVLTLGGLAPHSMGLSSGGGGGGEGIWQPLDSDLTSISGLNPLENDIIQRKSGVWTNRTVAQLAADIGAIGGVYQPLNENLTEIAAVDPAAIVGASPDNALLTWQTVVGDPTGGEWQVMPFPSFVTELSGFLQPADPVLDALSAAPAPGFPAANRISYYTSASTSAFTAISAGGRALINTTAATDKLPYYTSSTAAATTTLTSFARTLLDDTTAAAMRTTLEIGTSSLYATAKVVTTTNTHLIAGDSSLVHLAPGLNLYLPNTPDAGQRFTIYDYQDGWHTSNVTIFPGTGHTVEGAASLKGTMKRQALTFAYSDSDWSVVANTSPYAETDYPINIRTTADMVSGNKDAVTVPAGSPGMRMYKDGSWSVGFGIESGFTGGSVRGPLTLAWRAKGNTTFLGAIARVRDFDDNPQYQIERVGGPQTQVGTGVATNPATGTVVLGWDPVDMSVTSLGLDADDTAWPDVVNDGDAPPILALTSQQLSGVTVDGKKTGQGLGRATCQSLSFGSPHQMVDVTGWAATVKTSVTLSTTPHDIVLNSPGIRQPPDSGKLILAGSSVVITYTSKNKGATPVAGYAQLFKGCTIPSGSLLLNIGDTIHQRITVANGDNIGLGVKPNPGVGNEGTGLLAGQALGRLAYCGGFIDSDGVPGSSKWIDVTKGTGVIASNAEEDFTDSAQGANLSFATVPPGNTGSQERMIITGLGVVDLKSGLSFGKRDDAIWTAADTVSLYKVGQYSKTDVEQFIVLTGDLDGTAAITTTVPGDATHDEVQTLTITASSGVFRLQWTDPAGDTWTTEDIDFDTRPGGIQTALQDLRRPDGTIIFTGGDVQVTKSLGVYTITFGGIPSETGLEFTLNETSAVTINKILGGTVDGQLVGFRSTTSHHTFHHQATGTDTIELAGGAGLPGGLLTLGVGDYISFSYNLGTGRWHQRGMSGSGGGSSLTEFEALRAQNGDPVTIYSSTDPGEDADTAYYLTEDGSETLHNLKIRLRTGHIYGNNPRFTYDAGDPFYEISDYGNHFGGSRIWIGEDTDGDVQGVNRNGTGLTGLPPLFFDYFNDLQEDTLWGGRRAVFGDVNDPVDFIIQCVRAPVATVASGTVGSPKVLGYAAIDIDVDSLGTNAAGSAFGTRGDVGIYRPAVFDSSDPYEHQQSNNFTYTGRTFGSPHKLTGCKGEEYTVVQAVTLNTTTDQNVLIEKHGFRNESKGRLIKNGTPGATFTRKNVGRDTLAGVAVSKFTGCRAESGTVALAVGDKINAYIKFGSGSILTARIDPQPAPALPGELPSWGSNTVAGSGLGRITWRGTIIDPAGVTGKDVATGYSPSIASIGAEAAEDFYSNAAAGRIYFRTNPYGATGNLKRAQIEPLGQVNALAGFAVGAPYELATGPNLNNATPQLGQVGQYAYTDVGQMTYTVLTGAALTVAISTITAGDSSHNEVQRVDVAGGVADDQYTLTFNGETTEPIDYDTDLTAANNAAAANTVKEALQALPSSLAGDFVVTRTIVTSTIQRFTVTFGGALTSSKTRYKITNTSPTTITNLLVAGEAVIDGQLLYLRATNTNTTIAHNSSGAGKIWLKDATTRALANNENVFLLYDNSFGGFFEIGGATTSGSGLSNNSVTDAYLRDSAALTVIGRSANTTGDPADIAAGSDGDVLRRSGTTLGFGTIPQASVTSLVSDLAGKQAAGSYQPLDADLTAIAALATDSFGRGLLPLTTAAAVRTYIGAGTGSGSSVFTTPEDFGAAGDGTTDDSAEIAAWLAADGPKRAPADADAKNYLVAGTFTIAQSDDIDFGGATLSCKNSSTTGILVTADNVTIRNLVFDGRRTGTSVVSQGITWEGANGKMVDCEVSNHNDNDAAILVDNAGAELTCVRCAAHNNGRRAAGDSGSVLRVPTHETVSISYGMDGFAVITGRLETYDCKANFNSRCGLYTSATADEGCVVDLVQCKGNYSALIRTTGSPTLKNDRTYNGAAASVCLRSNVGTAHRIHMDGMDESDTGASRYGLHIGAFGGGSVSESGEWWKVDSVVAENFEWIDSPSAAEAVFLRGGHSTHIKSIYTNNVQGYGLAFGGGANNVASGDNAIPTGHRIDQVVARGTSNPSVSISVGRNISIGHVYIYGSGSVDVGEGTASVVDTISIDKISAFECVSGVFVNTGPTGAGTIDNIYVGEIEAHDCLSTAAGWPNALVWLIGKTTIGRIYAHTPTGNTKPNYIVKSEDDAVTTGQTHFIELFEPISYNTASYLIANTSNIVIRLQPYTGSKALVTDASGYIAPSSVTATELGYLSGAASLATDDSDTSVATTQYVRAQKDRQSLVNTGMGLIAATVPENVAVGVLAIVTGTTYWMGVGLKKGDSITNLLARMTVVGATLSLAKMAVATVSGTTATVVAVSGNVNSTFTSGANKWASVPCAYTAPADGMYYLAILAVGTTGPTILRTASNASIQVGSNPFLYGTTAAQTDIVLSNTYTVASTGNALCMGCN